MPREAWVREFRLDASPSADGDDFAPLPLDRAAELRETAEAQWFELVTGPAAPAPPGGQRFPAVVLVRRLRITLLSTWGDGRPGAAPVRAALGEVAAYGPDLEVVVGGDGSSLRFGPAQIAALSGRPKWVFFFNRANTPVPHDIASVGMQQNLRVRLEDRRVASGILAASTRRSSALCGRLPGGVLAGPTSSQISQTLTSPSTGTTPHILSLRVRRELHAAFLARPAPAARAVFAAPAAAPAAAPTPGPHSGLPWDQRPCTTPARGNAGDCQLGILTLETSRFLPEDEREALLAARGLRSRYLLGASSRAPAVWLDQLEPLDRAEWRRHLSEPTWRHPAAERWERALAAPTVARIDGGPAAPVWHRQVRSVWLGMP